MKRIVKGLFLVFLALIVVALTAGCGGGGGGNSGGGRHIAGRTNIYRDAQHPRVGLVNLTVSGSPTLVSSSVARSTSGWQWIDFSIPEPSKPSSTEVYTVTCWDDADGNGKYKTSELLGFADEFVAYRSSDKQWRIYTSSIQDLGSAFDYNIEIDCTYRSASYGATLSSLDTTKKVPVMTREEAENAQKAIAAKLAQQ